MVHSSTIDQLINLTGGKFPNCSVYVHEGVITRELYEARKAERQNKPDWGRASDWAHWLAQDSFGKWWWYPNCKDAPKLGTESFVNQSVDRVIFAGSGQVIGDWRNTLEHRPNHIGESDEKAAKAAKFISDVAVVSPYLAVRYARRLLPDLFDNSPSLGESDWYDYDKQEATKLPPVGAVVNFEWGGYHRGAVEIVAYRNNGNTAVLWNVDRDAPDAAEVMSSSFRPLDWNRKQEVPSPSPELSFHLSNAFNELQASARLLPEDDPRRASIVSLAGGVGAVKEAV